MKKLMIFSVILGVMLASAGVVMAEGPTNAGGNSDKWAFGDGIWIGPAGLYIGPDYGAGWTPTTTVDSTRIAPIGSEENPATLLAKGHYFSEWPEPFSEKDWVYYKFWLTGPVKITFEDESEYIATKFITLKQWMVSQDIELVNYK